MPFPPCRSFFLSRLSPQLFLAALLLLLTACAAPPPAELKPPALPETFSRTGEAPLPSRWWRSFEDPDLDRLMEQSLAGNLSLRAAWSRLEQARALARRAGADRFPSLDLEAAAGLSRRTASGEANARDYSLGLAARYEIDLWGRIGSEAEAARLDARAGAFDLQTAAMSLSASVAGAWYELAEQLEQLRLLDEQIRVNGQVLELVRLRFRTGGAISADVLQQEQLIESRRGQRSRVLARMELLQHRLAILQGRSPGLELPAYGPQLPGLSPLPDTGLPAELLARRPDLRSAWSSLLAADRRFEVAVSERYPRLSLSARLDTGGDELARLFDDWLASLAANLALPLVDGGRLRAEQDRALALTEQRLHEYGQSVIEAMGEVEDALSSEAQRRILIASLERQMELAEASIKSLRERYVQGAADYQRILSALLSYQQLQSGYLTARLDLIRDRIALCRSLGGGWLSADASPPVRGI